MSEQVILDSSQLADFEPTEAAIAEMKSKYMGLSISGIDDKDGFKAVHDARMIVRGHRVDVEKRRKELKAGALEYGRKVDAAASKIKDQLKPIEDHLQAEENAVKREKERIEQEKREAAEKKLRERQEAFAAVGVVAHIPDLLRWSDDECQTELDKATDAYLVEQKRLEEEKAEAERKHNEEEDARRAEAERLDKERKKLEADRERMKQEMLDKELELNRQQREIEAEKERQRIEKEKAEAVERSKKEEAERIERERQEKLRREEEEIAEQKRLESLRPDQEKLAKYADELLAVQVPNMRLKKNNKFAEEAFGIVESVAAQIKGLLK